MSTSNICKMNTFIESFLGMQPISLFCMYAIYCSQTETSPNIPEHIIHVAVIKGLC